jgi:hypothetical protein
LVFSILNFIFLNHLKKFSEKGLKEEGSMVAGVEGVKA